MKKVYYQPKLYYDFEKLAANHPDLNQFFIKSSTRKDDDHTISNKSNFKFTNESTNLLFKYIMLDEFHIDILNLHMNTNLCPVIPSRIQYLLNIRDVLMECGLFSEGTIDEIEGIDVGTGVYGVYALLAYRLFNWKMIATDIDDNAIKNLDLILRQNQLDKNIITLTSNIFQNFEIDIFQTKNKIHFTMCNPPFYESQQDLEQSYKQKGFKSQDHELVIGSSSELIYSSSSSSSSSSSTINGELGFIMKMVQESYTLRDKIVWFSSIVSKKSNVLSLIKYLMERTNNYHVRSFTSGEIEHWLLFWSYQGYRTHHQLINSMKNIQATSIYLKIDLSLIPNVLNPLKEYLQIRKEEAINSFEIIGYDVCWKRSFQRKIKQRRELTLNKKIDKFKFIYQINADCIHWKFGYDPTHFQSFCAYITQKLQRFKK